MAIKLKNKLGIALTLANQTKSVPLIDAKGRIWVFTAKLSHFDTKLEQVCKKYNLVPEFGTEYRPSTDSHKVAKQVLTPIKTTHASLIDRANLTHCINASKLVQTYHGWAINQYKYLDQYHVHQVDINNQPCD
tara:strand:+ start:1629 stop:2027 length:399 start_codon:yes stop_codon:yes gene_type:complete